MLERADQPQGVLERRVTEAVVDRISVLVLGQPGVIRREADSLTSDVVGLEALHDVPEAVVDETEGQRDPARVLLFDRVREVREEFAGTAGDEKGADASRTHGRVDGYRRC